MPFRAFIAVDVVVSDKYREFQKELKDTGVRLKCVDSENLHLTLKFLGDIDNAKVSDIEKSIYRSVAGMQPIQCKLRGTGVFPNEENIKVVWVGMDGAESMMDIVESLEDELEQYGFPREDRAYIPHLTVARTKFDRSGGSENNAPKLLPVIQKYAEEEFGAVRIDSVKLMKSELTPNGPVYGVVKEVRFF
ncbi:MAG: RNA 2',3'-cyclic phosphodiesterase [Candidatus Thermoplasmatota archaeon]|nr:RNA 2',3'-cyclic phosphodiesterase [Candidatus Thermoplasmatota archaeon]